MVIQLTEEKTYIFVYLQQVNQFLLVLEVVLRIKQDIQLLMIYYMVDKVGKKEITLCIYERCYL